MRDKFFVLLLCGHLLFIASKSFPGVLPLQKLVTSPTANHVLDVYTTYTAIQSDYGFFSPNVANATALTITVHIHSDSIKFPFDIEKGEIGIRRFTSLNAFNSLPEAREFMTRSWAAYALQKHPKATAITVSYFKKVSPALNRYPVETSSVDSLIFQVKYNVDEE